MKIIYFGGQKSGKTALAIKKTLELSNQRTPNYIATYNNNYDDNGMEERVTNHKKERKELFRTIEEPFKIYKKIVDEELYLIDCINMWVLNLMMRKESEKEIVKKAKKLISKNADIIFVINDLSRGVIPMEKFSREYIDIVGRIGQVIAKDCDEVYSVTLGIEQRIK